MHAVLESGHQSLLYSWCLINKTTPQNVYVIQGTHNMQKFGEDKKSLWISSQFYCLIGLEIDLARPTHQYMYIITKSESLALPISPCHPCLVEITVILTIKTSLHLSQYSTFMSGPYLLMGWRFIFAKLTDPTSVNKNYWHFNDNQQFPKLGSFHRPNSGIFTWS